MHDMILDSELLKHDSSATCMFVYWFLLMASGRFPFSLRYSKLMYVANDTHPKCGKRSSAAVPLMGWKTTMVATILPHRATMSTRACSVNMKYGRSTIIIDTHYTN